MRVCNDSFSYRPVSDLEPKKMFVTGFGFVKAFIDGMVKTYAIGGTVAIIYKTQGLWLLGPMLAGGGISAGAKIFEHAHARYPDNKVVATCARGMKRIDQTLIGFFEDFGFTWSMLRTIVMQSQGREYAEVYFGRVVAPWFSFPAAFLIRYAHYHQHAHEENQHPQDADEATHLTQDANAASQHPQEREHNRGLTLLARSFGAACSPAFIIDVLHEQNVLAEDSFIPLGVFIGAGVLGLIGGACLLPTPPTIKGLKMAERIEKFIEFFGENLSLTAAFFAFPTDIMAAVNNDDIPDAFLYTVGTFAVIYSVMLSAASSGYFAQEKESKRISTNADDDFMFLDGNNAINTSDTVIRISEDSAAVK